MNLGFAANPKPAGTLPFQNSDHNPTAKKAMQTETALKPIFVLLVVILLIGPACYAVQPILVV